MLQLLKRFFNDTWSITNAEALRFQQSPEGRKADAKAIIICITVAFILTVIHYFNNPDFLVSFLKALGMDEAATDFDAFISSDNRELKRLAYWAGILVLCYFALPLIIIRFVFRESTEAYGLQLRGALKSYPVYLLMLLVMIPLVWYFSGTKSFQARYPFYTLAEGEELWPNFWIWQALYFLQFCAVEFFFRGFMLHGTKQRFGFYSVFVMTIPYCMIHFGKPMPETISAIIAGIVLGTLSLKSRSVWLGIAIHYTVALSMDLAALLRKGIV